MKKITLNLRSGSKRKKSPTPDQSEPKQTRFDSKDENCFDHRRQRRYEPLKKRSSFEEEKERLIRSPNFGEEARKLLEAPLLCSKSSTKEPQRDPVVHPSGSEVASTISTSTDPEGRKEGRSLVLGLCASVLAPSSVDSALQPANNSQTIEVRPCASQQNKTKVGETSQSQCSRSSNEVDDDQEDEVDRDHEDVHLMYQVSYVSGSKKQPQRKTSGTKHCKSCKSEVLPPQTLQRNATDEEDVPPPKDSTLPLLPTNLDTPTDSRVNQSHSSSPPSSG